MKIIEQSARLLSVYCPDAEQQGVAGEKLIEFAARNCYASHDKTTDTSYRRMLPSLIKRSHTAPLEFADLVFDITTSRAVLAELTRHRLASFCVSSQRYIQEAGSGDISFIRPEWVRENDEVDGERKEEELQWFDSMANAERDYIHLISLGRKPEEAREVLPNSTACRIIMKANAREFRHFFQLRCDKAAYPQMRALATSMLKQAAACMPEVFGDLMNKEINDGREQKTKQSE